MPSPGFRAKQDSVAKQVRSDLPPQSFSNEFSRLLPTTSPHKSNPPPHVFVYLPPSRHQNTTDSMKAREPGRLTHCSAVSDQERFRTPEHDFWRLGRMCQWVAVVLYTGIDIIQL